MATDLHTYFLMAMPWVTTILYLVIGLAVVIGLGFYLFVVKRRRFWIANLYEQKADGRLHFIGRDKVIERKINKGKQVVYLMKKYRSEVLPPPWECTHRYFNKEYTDYIRVSEDDFRPAKKSLEFNLAEKENKKKFTTWIKDATAQIRRLTTKEVYDDYIFAPVHNTLAQKMTFDAIDYDINMMRINAIDNRDKIYADRADFWEKYGTIIAIGVVVVLIIVVLYMSYEYSAQVIGQGYGQLANAKQTVVQDLATKLNTGTPPS